MQSSFPYPGFRSAEGCETARKALRVRPEANEFAARNAGTINLFIDEKNTHVHALPPSPRCLSQAAKDNYVKGRGCQMSSLICGKAPESETEPLLVPRYYAFFGIAKSLDDAYFYSYSTVRYSYLLGEYVSLPVI